MLPAEYEPNKINTKYEPVHKKKQPDLRKQAKQPLLVHRNSKTTVQHSEGHSAKVNVALRC